MQNEQFSNQDLISYAEVGRHFQMTYFISSPPVIFF